MTDDEVEFWRVDQDLMLCGLHGQDVGHMLVRDGIAVGLELDAPFKIADPKRHFRAVIRMEWQACQGGQFLFEKEFQGLSLIHISEPTRRTPISYAVFCLKKKNIV